MIRSVLIGIGILVFQCSTASALTSDHQSIKSDLDYGFDISTLASPADRTDALFSTESNHATWIQEKLGEDFYHFYAKKVIKKPSSKNSLQFEYFLNPELKSNNTSNQFIKISTGANAAEVTSIQALKSSKISFSEDSMEWNPADIAIINLGEDYQKYIDDEISAGHTYREFWDGVETTEFEDFIDEHFGFHDNALLRYLAMLGILLVAILMVAKRAELADFIMSEQNIDRFKKWFSSIYRFS